MKTPLVSAAVVSIKKTRIVLFPTFCVVLSFIVSAFKFPLVVLCFVFLFFSWPNSFWAKLDVGTSDLVLFGLVWICFQKTSED